MLDKLLAPFDLAAAVRVIDFAPEHHLHVLKLTEERLAEVFAIERSLRLQAETSGYWPLIVGDDGDLHRVTEHLRRKCSAGYDWQSVITEAVRFNFQTWATGAFNRQRQTLQQHYESGDVDKIMDELTGEWPASTVPMNTYLVACDVKPVVENGVLGGRLEIKPQLNLLFVETTKSWHVPAMLCWGGWNASPEAQIHSAAARHWHRKYGAVPEGWSEDHVAYAVDAPPRNREEAYQLALEQFAVCPDNVSQNYGSLRNLAAHLVDSHIWNFWWD